MMRGCQDESIHKLSGGGDKSERKATRRGSGKTLPFLEYILSGWPLARFKLHSNDLDKNWQHTAAIF